MVRAAEKDSTAGLGQTLRTGRPLVGGFSFHDVSGMCTNPLAHGLPGSPRHERCVSLALGVGQLLATHTPWVALSAVYSEHLT